MYLALPVVLVTTPCTPTTILARVNQWRGLGVLAFMLLHLFL
jgi:hypothetical protein